METTGPSWHSWGVPHPSRHATSDLDDQISAVREQGADPDFVTYVCMIGAHEDCNGKVVRESDNGIETCRCPVCKHPRVT